MTSDADPRQFSASEVLGVPAATDRAAWNAIPDALILPIVGAARAALDDPWPTLPASEYLLFHRTGERHGYERRIWARRDRLTRGTVAAARSLDPRLVDDVIDGVWAWCEQSSWCWPAHDDRGGRLDDHLPDVGHPYLDLGAGEAAAQLALVDHILGAHLDERAPGIRRRIRHEAATRVFGPLAARRDWPWLDPEGGAHNWNPWIHGNVLIAAVALLEGDDRTAMVSLVREGLDYFLRDLPADGATDEGYGYWWNGALRAVEASELLRRLGGGAVDPAEPAPGLPATLDFPRRMFIGPGSVDGDGAITSDWVVNWADGSALDGDALPWHSLYRAARRLGREPTARFAVAHRGAAPHPAMGLGRLAAHLCDAEWLAEPGRTFPLARDTWFESIQTLVARERADTTSGLALAVKAGHNGEHHNHNDVGSFVVAVDGVPLIVDPGRTTYTAQTFGPDRYENWALTSDWHNVPAVHTCPQRPGREWTATHVTPSLARSPGEPTSITCNLAGAYDTPIPAWTRTITLRRGHPAVEVDDAWPVDATDRAHHVIRLIVAGRVDDLGDATLRIAGASAGTTLVVTHSGSGVTIERRHLEDPMLTRVWGGTLTRVNILVPHDAGAHRLHIAPGTPAPPAGRRGREGAR